MRYILFLTLICLAANCGSGLEMVTEKAEDGTIQEQYTINSKTSEKEGLYKSFDRNGDLIEESAYKAGQLDGERRIYYEDGSVQSIETFVAGQHDGRYLSFHENGKVALQGDYVMGAMEGEWKAYYTNGQMKEVVEFRANNENGSFTEYYENGQLKAEGTYLNGDKEDGLLKLYDEEGVLKRKMNCKSGVCKTIWERSADTQKE
ncbi:MAG: toxin-antitoxin system YwqK family antitoxin [Bacteroidota bacterium]